jgi:hypothetical protein
VEVIDPGALPARHSVSVAGVIVFRCRILAGQLTPNDEVTEFQWATEDEVTHLVSEAHAVRVLDALQPPPPLPFGSTTECTS